MKSFHAGISALFCTATLLCAPATARAQDAEASAAAEILSMVGKWVGGGITSALIGKAVSTILSGNGDAQILAKLDDIITTQNKILDELSALEDEVILETLKGELAEPRANIETAFSDLQSYAGGKITGAELKADIDNWAKSVVGSWDIDKSMTSINTIALGTLSNGEPAMTGCTKAASPGLLLEAYTKNIAEVRKDQDKRRYIDVYQILRGYLGQVYNLQYKGVVVLVNAHLHLGEPETALVALKAMQTNLQAQLKCVQAITPDSLRYVAGTFSKADTATVRFKSKRDGKVMYNLHPAAQAATVRMQAPAGSEWETWLLQRFDAKARSFHVKPVNDNVGDVVFDSQRLTWWAGATNKEKWLIVPSSDTDYVLIVSEKGKAWAWEGEKTIGNWTNKVKTWPVTTKGKKSGEVVDETNTRWTIEFSGDPPAIFP